MLSNITNCKHYFPDEDLTNMALWVESIDYLTTSLPDPVSRKSLRLVIARNSTFRSVSCVDAPMCGNSMFCGNARNRGFTRGSSGNTSRPTDANYVTR